MSSSPCSVSVKMARIEAAARSHPGHVRENNEDNFFMNGIFMSAGERNAGGLYKAACDDKHQLYAVCDGMGGLDQGEKASLMTVSSLKRLLSVGFRSLQKDLQEYIDEISAALYSTSGEAHSAGSTLTIVYITGNRFVTANLGDSRVYFKRRTLPLSLITEDHSQAMWYLSHGILTPEEAEAHESRNILRRYIGAPVQEGKKPDISRATRMKQGDVLLLCSDGLSNMLSSFEMNAEISDDKSCSDICRTLVTLALNRGADDNITALMLRVY